MAPLTFELRTCGMSSVGQPELKLHAAPGRLDDAGRLLLQIVGFSISSDDWRPEPGATLTIDGCRYRLLESDGLLNLQPTASDPDAAGEP